MREIEIGPNDGGQRLDRFLSKYLPKASPSFLQKQVRKKKIKVNKQRARAEQIIAVGDRIQFYLYEEVLQPLEEEARPRRSRISLSILYEDDHICIIDKPAGLLSHAASKKDYGNNLVDALEAYLIDKGDYIPRLEHSFRPALANRLDFNTAGLVIGLKSHRGALAINRALSEGRIDKYYRAYCHGFMEGHFTIDRPLEKQGQTMELSQKGQEAITEVEVLEGHPDWSYIQVRLRTGRYHQIRAHLASIGHPLVGDRRYGKKGDGSFPHQLLLSFGLVFHEIEGMDELEGLKVFSNQRAEFDRLKLAVDRAFQNERGIHGR